MSGFSEKAGRYKKFFGFIFKYWNSSLLNQTRAHALELPAEEEEQEEDSGYSPQDLVEDLQNMGPTFIKLGQLLSTRPDLLPDAYLKALSTLQDQVAPIPYEQLVQLIEEEIGTRISKGFLNFEEKPLASASIGQVHRATLRSGKQVVVKVQRPGIRREFLEDLEMLKEITDFGVKYSEAARKYALDNILEELRHIVLQELDYTREAANLVTLAGNLQKFPRLIIPQPVLDYCSSKVLTMEYVHGIKATSVSPLTLMENDLSPLVDELVEAYLQQIVVDGFVHADPHPGNIQLTPENNLVLIDLGMVAKFTPRMQEKLLQLLLGISKKDGDSVIDVLLSISEITENSDLDTFRRGINRQIMDTQDHTAREMQAGRQLIQMNRIAAENGIHIAVELNILGKVLLNLDQIVAVLAPDFDLQASLKKHIQEMMQSRLISELKPENFLNLLLEIKKFTEKFPARMNKLFSNLANNEFRIKVDAIDEKQLAEDFQKVANRIALGLIIAAAIVGAAMLMQVPSDYTILGYPAIAMLFFLIAAAGGILLSYFIIFKDEKNSRKKR